MNRAVDAERKDAAAVAAGIPEHPPVMTANGP